ncbi:putative Peptidase M20 domain-containing protein 2 [Hypsibius exemplaris]|uniref:Peptidase M20 domain-containing protein 2 n=1 Tax=Hypsibius exemplaris TaxID=2072580 RepID=A0A1W0XDN8_HYPEX|nr:putative Peptidase M20 domain-containing protein 2 [Hypsibius exemplaris]
MEEIHQGQISDTLARHADSLNDISQKIWREPELYFQEKFAHNLLTDFLERNGFTVVRGYKNIATAFRAEFQSPNYDRLLHPTIAVLCEYDALPEIGHACGHNLIAEAGIATGLALRDVLTSHADTAQAVDGKLVILGTPAEEQGGGKVILINEGAFLDIDFAMMVHPFVRNDLEPVILGIEACRVEFRGKAAHAACGPWEAVNALDAAVSLYQNVALFR